MTTILAIWNAFTTWCAAHHDAIIIAVGVLLFSYVAWCDKRKQTTGWFYALACAILDVLPNRRGKTDAVRIHELELENTRKDEVITELRSRLGGGAYREPPVRPYEPPLKADATVESLKAETSVPASG